MLQKIQEKFQKLMKMNRKDIKSAMAQKQENIAKGVANGDPDVWHHILMGIMLLFVGLFLIGTIFVEFLLDMQATRLQEGIPIVRSKVNSKLPPGDYHLFGLVHSGDSRETIQNLVWLVSSSEGGVLVAVKAPAGTQLPADFSIPTDFKITVDENGGWKLSLTPEAAQKKNSALKEAEAHKDSVDATK